MKILKKNKNMIRGIHYFSTELKTEIDVIPKSCFNLTFIAICTVLKLNFIFLVV